MEIICEDADLAAIEAGEAVKSRLPVATIRAVRRKLTLMRAAPSEHALRNWRSLRYEEQGDQSQISLDARWRIVLRLEKERQPQRLYLLRVDENKQ